MDDFMPDGAGRSPLARVDEFVHTTCPQCGGPARRETDTMGGFACSSWYFLRFCNPQYASGPFDPQAVKFWMPVDLYVGGAEHAVLHLLYARFWTRVLADAGLVDFREPFARLLNQGQMMGPDGKRMSKSRGNVITPDSIVASHGADALRIYELFMAPFEQDVDWNTEGLSGARRFLNRIWTLYAENWLEGGDAEPDPAVERVLHQTIRKVTERIETLRFNTMISGLMGFVNQLSEWARVAEARSVSFHQALETLIVLLAPAAPHLADEIWALTGHSGSVHQAPWPAWNPELAKEEMVQVPVQVNGRLRGVVEAPVESTQDEIGLLAMESPKVKAFVQGKTIQQIIYVPGKVFNIVVR
jgi:leucyl-tRNA synthetase